VVVPAEPAAGELQALQREEDRAPDPRRPSAARRAPPGSVPPRSAVATSSSAPLLPSERRDREPGEEQPRHRDPGRRPLLRVEPQVQVGGGQRREDHRLDQQEQQHRPPERRGGTRAHQRQRPRPRLRAGLALVRRRVAVAVGGRSPPATAGWRPVPGEPADQEQHQADHRQDRVQHQAEEGDEQGQRGPERHQRGAGQHHAPSGSAATSVLVGVSRTSSRSRSGACRGAAPRGPRAGSGVDRSGSREVVGRRRRGGRPLQRVRAPGVRGPARGTERSAHHVDQRDQRAQREHEGAQRREHVHPVQPSPPGR
jgi:hypothetical protein